MDLDELLNQIDFSNDLAEKRNEKVLTLLGRIIGELSKPSVQVTQVNLNKLESLVEKITTPDFSQLDNVAKSMEKVIDILVAKIDNIKKEETPKEWTFQVYRDKDGLMKHVKAKATLN